MRRIVVKFYVKFISTVMLILRETFLASFIFFLAKFDIINVTLQNTFY